MSDYNLRQLRDAYNTGQNITDILKNVDGLNDEEAIRVAYDLQSGSYVDYYRRNADELIETSKHYSEVLSPLLSDDSTILDCGTGELVTLAGIQSQLKPHCRWLAFDISLSRLFVGKEYLRNHNSMLDNSPTLFCAAMSRIPLTSHSVDIVMTSHSLEPNRGRERELIQEIFRVARHHVVLFEPNYEAADSKTRARMDQLGYVRDLTTHIAACGGHLRHMQELPYRGPLHNRFAYIIDLPRAKNDFGFICPKTSEQLVERENFLWSSSGMYAYPIFGGIPLLQKDAGVVLTEQ